MASRFRRRVVTFLLVGYTAFVMVITLSPRMPGSGTVSRIVNRILKSLHDRGLFLNVDYMVVEFIGNILMFVPLGFFAGLLISRRWWPVLLILGTMFSGGLELGQQLFLPDRFPEIRDLVSNTTGFLIGAGIALFIRMMVAHRDSLVEKDRREAELQNYGRY